MYHVFALVRNSLTKQSVNVSEGHSRHQCKPLITMAFGHAIAPAVIAGGPVRPYVRGASLTTGCTRLGFVMSIDQHPSIGPHQYDIPPAIVREVRDPKSWWERLNDLMEALLNAMPPKADPSVPPVIMRPRQIAALWHWYAPPVTAVHPAFSRPRQIAPLA